MRLPLSGAFYRQSVENLPTPYFQFTRQVVNSDLLFALRIMNQANTAWSSCANLLSKSGLFAGQRSSMRIATARSASVSRSFAVPAYALIPSDDVANSKVLANGQAPFSRSRYSRTPV